MTHILGVSAGFHDAAAAVIDHHGDILFAGHSERYSKKKNDANLCPELIEEIFNNPVPKVIDPPPRVEEVIIKPKNTWINRG